MEFSKKLLVIQYFVSAILVVVTIVGAFTGHDVTAIAMIAGTSVLADGTVTGFYFWKSKNENRAKYAQKFVTLFAKEYGIDAAIKISEVVLKD